VLEPPISRVDADDLEWTLAPLSPIATESGYSVDPAPSFAVPPAHFRRVLAERRDLFTMDALQRARKSGSARRAR
jgi:hypothetical protein